MNKTTDNQNEIFDVVNEMDQVIGKATRKEVHSNKKLIHRSVGILIFNSKNELLLQQRSATKDIEPLKWTISSSGHVIAGSSYGETAERELQEELGIQVPLEPVTKFLCKAPFETEICTIYKGMSNGPFRIHPQEIRLSEFYSLFELKKNIASHAPAFSFMGKMTLQCVGIV